MNETIPGLDLIPQPYRGYALLALLTVPHIGRGYHALRNGGGLVSIYRGIVFGTNTPAPAAPIAGTVSAAGRVLPLLLVVGLLAAPGCVTGPDGKRVPDVQLMQSVAKDASYLGTTFYLRAQPQDRPLFLLARDSLATLIAAGSFSPDQLSQALSNLPIRELKGEQGELIVGAAVTLWDAYGRQLAALDQDKVFETYVQPGICGSSGFLSRVLLGGARAETRRPARPP